MSMKLKALLFTSMVYVIMTGLAIARSGNVLK